MILLFKIQLETRLIRSQVGNKQLNKWAT